MFIYLWFAIFRVVVVSVVRVEEEEYVCRWVHAWPTFLDQRGIQCIPPSPLCSVVSAPDIPRHTPAPNLLTHSDENFPKIQITPKLPIFIKKLVRMFGWVVALANKSERHLWHGRQGKSALALSVLGPRDEKFPYVPFINQYARTSIQFTLICENVSKTACFLASSHSNK